MPKPGDRNAFHARPVRRGIPQGDTQKPGCLKQPGFCCHTENYLLASSNFFIESISALTPSIGIAL